MSSISEPDTGFKTGETFVKVFIGLVAGSMVLAVIFNILKWAADQEQKPKEAENEGAPDVEKQTVEMFIDYMLKEKAVRFSSQQISSFTSNYSTKLGSGGFGEVYKGHFPNGVQVAVKRLKNHGVDKTVEEQFMAEIGTIGRTYHRNLVRLYGFCFSKETKALVYEYMENGSLDQFLFGKKEKILQWEKLQDIALGTAKGLDYLHHHGLKTIIHYDIKPANVLLDSSFCAKIADFGLAKLCNKDSTHVTLSGGRGTPGYAAPELWMPFPVTYKCDVYSFGMMLFEIVGKRKNLDIKLGESQEWFPRRVWEKFEKGELEEVILDSGIMGEKEKEMAKTMTMVALWCVQYLPEARPSMSSVVKILEGDAQVTTPPNPFNHLVPNCDESSVCTENSSYTATTTTTMTGSTTEEKNENIERDDTPIMKKYEIEYATS